MSSSVGGCGNAEVMDAASKWGCVLLLMMMDLDENE